MAGKTIKRIGILSGGGDAPGINAVIRAVAKTAMIDYGWEVFGIYDGFEGTIFKQGVLLSKTDLSSIINLGGTILGTSNKADPYAWVDIANDPDAKKQDVSKQAIENLRQWGIDALVVIGGDGTNMIARRVMADGVPVVTVPKTIDNDISDTEVTFGFHTAVEIVTEAIDRIHTTAQSHSRVMVVEVMGRYAGWIALAGGIAGGGDVILIPEIPYDINVVAETVLERKKSGKRFSIIVVAEGAHEIGGKVSVSKVVKGSPEPNRLGGIGAKIAEEIEELTKVPSRVTVLGHLQRGGTPTAYDRIISTEYGVYAANLIAKGLFGNMVCMKNGKVSHVPLSEVPTEPRCVPLDHAWIKTALSVGASFGVARIS